MPVFAGCCVMYVWDLILSPPPRNQALPARMSPDKKDKALRKAADALTKYAYLMKHVHVWLDARLKGELAEGELEAEAPVWYETAKASCEEAEQKAAAAAAAAGKGGKGDKGKKAAAASPKKKRNLKEVDDAGKTPGGSPAKKARATR